METRREIISLFETESTKVYFFLLDPIVDLPAKVLSVRSITKKCLDSLFEKYRILTSFYVDEGWFFFLFEEICYFFSCFQARSCSDSMKFFLYIWRHVFYHFFSDQEEVNIFIFRKYTFDNFREFIMDAFTMIS